MYLKERFIKCLFAQLLSDDYIKYHPRGYTIKDKKTFPQESVLHQLKREKPLQEAGLSEFCLCSINLV